jgi:hypothetical protein
MLICFLASSLLIGTMGCDILKSGNLPNRNTLREKTRLNYVMKLTIMLNAPLESMVCILQPGQAAVYDNIPQKEVINQYLVNSDYSPDKEHWAMILATGNTIKVRRIKRAEDLDILPVHLPLVIQKALPKSFNPKVGCSVLKFAGFFKFEDDAGRIYLVFGESHEERVENKLLQELVDFSKVPDKKGSSTNINPFIQKYIELGDKKSKLIAFLSNDEFHVTDDKATGSMYIRYWISPEQLDNPNIYRFGSRVDIYIKYDPESSSATDQVITKITGILHCCIQATGNDSRRTIGDSRRRNRR